MPQTGMTINYPISLILSWKNALSTVKRTLRLSLDNLFNLPSITLEEEKDKWFPRTELLIQPLQISNSIEHVAYSLPLPWMKREMYSFLELIQILNSNKHI